MDLNTKRAFFVGLQKSRLLTAHQLSSVRRAAAEGASEAQIVRTLTRRQWLTPWQGEQLCAGHTGFRVGAYTLLDICGRGRMGIVYRARQSKSRRIVAIKVMSGAAAQDRAVGPILQGNPAGFHAEESARRLVTRCRTCSRPLFPRHRIPAGTEPTGVDQFRAPFAHRFDLRVRTSGRCGTAAHP